VEKSSHKQISKWFQGEFAEWEHPNKTKHPSMEASQKSHSNNGHPYIQNSWEWTKNLDLRRQNHGKRLFTVSLENGGHSRVVSGKGLNTLNSISLCNQKEW